MELLQVFNIKKCEFHFIYKSHKLIKDQYIWVVINVKIIIILFMAMTLKVGLLYSGHMVIIKYLFLTTKVSYSFFILNLAMLPIWQNWQVSFDVPFQMEKSVLDPR